MLTNFAVTADESFRTVTLVLVRSRVSTDTVVFARIMPTAVIQV